jgi:hypothetical protein
MERTDVARSIATSNGPDLHESGQRLCSVACYILGLGLGLGLENWFCGLSVCRHHRQALVQQNKAREGRR